jgi:hypothetical protein
LLVSLSISHPGYLARFEIGVRYHRRFSGMMIACMFVIAIFFVMMMMLVVVVFVLNLTIALLALDMRTFYVMTIAIAIIAFVLVGIILGLSRVS